jgi:hypothetical protein
MEEGYLRRSWRAVTSSRRWFGRICLLSLIAFVPICGPFLVIGYLYGWTRDVAWGIEGPLPRRRVFTVKNLRRGWFAFLTTLLSVLASLAVKWAVSAMHAAVAVPGGMAVLLTVVLYIASIVWGMLIEVAVLRTVLL